MQFLRHAAGSDLHGYFVNIVAVAVRRVLVIGRGLETQHACAVDIEFAAVGPRQAPDGSPGDCDAVGRRRRRAVLRVFDGFRPGYRGRRVQVDRHGVGRGAVLGPVIDPEAERREAVAGLVGGRDVCELPVGEFGRCDRPGRAADGCAVERQGPLARRGQRHDFHAVQRVAGVPVREVEVARREGVIVVFIGGDGAVGGGGGEIEPVHPE